jgi:hypothetical protein
MEVLRVVIPIALIVVFAILLTGVFAMARGGEFNRKYGNKLMRLRIVAQLLAIGLIVLFVYVSRH